MKKFIVSLFVISALAQATYAVAATTAYDGYTLPLPSDKKTQDSLPYGVVTQQDLYPLMTGYSLTQLTDLNNPGVNGSYDAPFNLPSLPATIYQPNFVVNQPVDLTIGSMLTTIPDSKIVSYYMSQPAKSFVDLQTLGTLQSSLNNQTTFANTPSGKNPNVLQIDKIYAAPFNAASLFDYMSPAALANSPFKDYLAYQQNPGEVYIALVSGGLTPPSAIEKPDANYLAQVRRIAAAQSAGAYALQQIFNRSKPISPSDTMMQQLSSNMPDADHQPKSPRDIEKFMATRRLDPKSGWYQHLQQASPLELQREQLYLQAEMLYEMQQIHETEEQNKMLLAISLLSQNYNNRTTMNQMQQINIAKNPEPKLQPNNQQQPGAIQKMMNLG